MAKHKIKTKYIPKQQINYREEDEITSHCHVQNLNVMNIKWRKTVQLISPDQNEILAYNTDDY